MLEFEKIRAYRLKAHHLDEKLPYDGIEEAAGACGLQNSPPGAWETALFNRISGCTQAGLQDVLYREKKLLQAWSWRGVPVVFPTDESDIFLSPLAAREGETPWIYTRGITAALDHVGLAFEELLPAVKGAAGYLDTHTVRSKESLDRILAELTEESLPEEKRKLWRAPSMYGAPDRQTVGGAVVSFMLRPCSFMSLVVFGERQESSPAFTSYKNWIGHEPVRVPDADKRLVRKYLHCYGPVGVNSFMDWLGCCPRQAKRLWNLIAEEMEPVTVQGKTRYMLSADMEDLKNAQAEEDKLILLGAHDPYLDMRDHEIILEDKKLQRSVWRINANPGVILKGGRAAGIWNARIRKDSMDITMTLYESFREPEKKKLRELAEEYAAFRGKKMVCSINALLGTK